MGLYHMTSQTAVYSYSNAQRTVELLRNFSIHLMLCRLLSLPGQELRKDLRITSTRRASKAIHKSIAKQFVVLEVVQFDFGWYSCKQLSLIRPCTLPNMEIKLSTLSTYRSDTSLPLRHTIKILRATSVAFETPFDRPYKSSPVSTESLPILHHTRRTH